jgi:hypothetical protein
MTQLLRGSLRVRVGVCVRVRRLAAIADEVLTTLTACLLLQHIPLLDRLHHRHRVPARVGDPLHVNEPRNAATAYLCDRYGMRPLVTHRSTVMGSTCTASASSIRPVMFLSSPYP